MTLLVDENKAKARLTYMTQALVAPILDEPEILDLLNDAKVLSVWIASTAFEFGAKVIPTANNRNGKIYKIVAFDGVGRTTGTTEPSWSASRASRVDDGNITWEECGDEPQSLWDLNAAAEAGWILKAGKVVPDFDYGDADHKMSAGQMHKHCLDQAQKFKTAGVA